MMSFMGTSMTRAFCILILLIFAICNSERATADDFLEGEAAFKQGDYQTALRLWTPLANEGNGVLQTAVGVMHNNGWGTSRDPATAAI